MQSTLLREDVKKQWLLNQIKVLIEVLPVHPKACALSASWLDTSSTKDDLRLGDRTKKVF